MFLNGVASVTTGGSEGDDLESPSVETSALTDFPTGLALASPTESDGSSTSYLSKQNKYSTMANNATDISQCVMDFTYSNRANPPCYGPTINYTNHPNAPNRDANTTNDDAPGSPNDLDGDGFLPVGDLGIWDKTNAGNGQACVAEFANNNIFNIAQKMDLASNGYAVVLCWMRVSEIDIPEIGDGPMDVSEAFSADRTLGQSQLSVISGSLERVEDNLDGHAVMKFNMSGNFQSGGAIDFEIKLQLALAQDDSGVFDAKMNYYLRSSQNTSQGCNLQGHTIAGEILINATEEGRLLARNDEGKFCGQNVQPDFDFSKTFTQIQNGWTDKYSSTKYDMNLDTGRGALSYAWMAGPLDSDSRVFNFQPADDASVNDRSGCGYFGYAQPVTLSDPEKVSKMICNWAGAGNNHQGIAHAQRQCVTWDGTKYISDDARLNITYAPTNTCNSDGTDGIGNPFSYSTQAQNSFNDRFNGGVVNHNLIPINQVDFELLELAEDRF